MRLRSCFSPSLLASALMLTGLLMTSAHAAPVQDWGILPVVDAQTDHIRGNPTPKVTLIEYADYECPFCKNHHKTMQMLMERFPNKINWVYRHFPLSFHQNAEKEAEASECIAELGGNDTFWKFTDAIFERTTSNGNGFSLAKLGPLAQELGVDQTKFQDCLDSGKYAKKVQAQMDAGTVAGVNGTPATFVVKTSNGKWQMISGAVDYPQFNDVVTAMLQSTWTPPVIPEGAGILPADAGVPAPDILPAEDTQTSAPPKVNLKTDHIRGNKDAKITLIEYADFECPFCQRHTATLAQLLRKYPKTVRIVYRHFPLEFHTGAKQKAEASECVAKLKGNEAFWKFHDLLFRRINVTVDKLPLLARSADIDINAFKKCTGGGTVSSHVAMDIQGGQESGVNGTPANFIVNERTGEFTMISGAVPLSSFTAVIDPMLKGKWKPTGAGILPADGAAQVPDVYIVPQKTVPAPDVDRSWDHILGDANARMSLVVYMGVGDPFSVRMYPMLQQLVDYYRGHLNVVYRHLPLNFQPTSQTGAEAMECAAELKGHAAFWSYANKLYAEPERTDYTAIAAQVGLDPSEMATCIFRGTRKQHVKQDSEGGTAAGVDGTPTSFLIDTLGKKQWVIQGAQPIESFRSTIDDAVKSLSP